MGTEENVEQCRKILVHAVELFDASEVADDAFQRSLEKEVESNAAAIKSMLSYRADRQKSTKEFRDELLMVQNLIAEKDKVIKEIPTLLSQKDNQRFKEVDEVKAELRKKSKALDRTEEKLRRTCAELADALQRLKDAECSGDVQLVVEARENNRKAMLRVVDSRCDLNMVPGLKPWLERLKLLDKPESTAMPDAKNAMERKNAQTAQAILRWCADLALCSQHDVALHIEAGGATAIDSFVEAVGLKGNEEQRVRDQFIKDRMALTKERANDLKMRQARRASEAIFQDAITVARDRFARLQQSWREGQGPGTDPDQLEAAKSEQTRAEHQARQARKDMQYVDIRWVVASAPFRSRDGFDLLGRLQDLSRDVSSVSVACDWSGSRSARLADRAAFEKATKLAERLQEAAVPSELMKDLAEAISQTLWFQLYKAGLKGAIKAQAWGSTDICIKAVCIQGGPISQVEHLLMPSIIKEVLLELGSLGHRDTKVDLVEFRSLLDFEEQLRMAGAGCARLDAKAQALVEQEKEREEQGLCKIRSPNKVSLRNADSLGIRWKQTCDQLSQANESLWLELRQPESNRSPAKTGHLLNLYMEMQQVYQHTTELRTHWERNRLSRSLAASRCRSTGSLPQLSSTR